MSLSQSKPWKITVGMRVSGNQINLLSTGKLVECNFKSTEFLPQGIQDSKIPIILQLPPTVSIFRYQNVIIPNLSEDKEKSYVVFLAYSITRTTRCTLAVSARSVGCGGGDVED